MFKSLPALFTDNRLRIILGSGCILFGVLNGVLYYRDLALAAQSKGDVHELNKRALAQKSTPSPSPSLKATLPPSPTPTMAASIVPSPTPTPKPAAAPSAKATPSVAASGAPSSTVTTGKVKITTATEAEFDTLPGIGPSKAKAIVEYRATHPFTKLEDLNEVTGIGDKTYESLLPHIEL